ncbi:MAG TPA: tetratricopeptide repeat protein [Thermoanaerobaculia bacterium]|jgi:tetratricopeptide (TPR) repeat protein
MSQHPDSESIAAFAEGKLRRAEVGGMTRHLAHCAACRLALEAANDAYGAEHARSRTVGINRWWIAAAAAAAVIAIFLVSILPLREDDPSARLASLLPNDRRLVEPRLSLERPYAPYRGPNRAGSAGNDSRAMERIGVAGQLAGKADRDPSAEAQQAAGVAMLLIDEPESAARRLRDAAAKASGDAGTWSDLAAAEYAFALRNDRPDRYPEALAAADRALRIDPNHPAALFNRALIVERLGVHDQARTAWQRYLAVDGSSPWAIEARARLGRLDRQSGDALFRRELPRLEAAAVAGDRDTVRAIVTAHPQPSRAWAEAEWPARWAAAFESGDEAGASRALSTARAVGDALAHASGESLVRDAVQQIDRHAPRLAAAYTVYRAGRLAYSNGLPRAAEPQLREAAARFASGGSPMSLVARYYAACARFDNTDVAGAREELAALLTEVRPYAALSAQVEWELALALMNLGDFNAALPLLARAEETFTRLGERSHAAFVGTLAADAQSSLGRQPQAWAARIRSLTMLSDEGRSLRLAVSLGAASRMDLRIGRLEAARALLRLEQHALPGNDALLTDALLREAMLAAKLGDPQGAQRAANEAGGAARRIADAALRARALADVDFATGAIAPDASRAKELLSRAIEVYRARALPFNLPEALLLRARASRKLGDATTAASDLAAGLETIEAHRTPLTGTGVHDAAEDLFDEAIALALDRGDVDAAFGYAERARGESGSDAAALIQRLRGTRTLILHVTQLAEEVVVFAVDGHGLAVRRQRPSRDLYDLIVRPFEPLLARNELAIFVADRSFANVSFAALHDGRRYLAEKIAVAHAESAGGLRVEAMPRPARVLSVALPATGFVALPDSLVEARDLYAIYANVTHIAAERATLPAFLGLARRSDVIHLAGHADREPGSEDPALLFADHRATWSAIATAKLDAQVVVLAACETLRVPQARESRALSLGAAFAAAGARDVVGTLTPIADADAHRLFPEFHRQLASGATAAEALRHVQLRAIAARDDAWKSVVLLTNRIPAARG